jgi:hypothetical protein
MPVLRSFALGLGWLLGAYLVVRAIAELFVIDLSDPATYRSDWGGPSLIGVLAARMLPGLLASTLMVRALGSRQATRSDRTTEVTPPR